MTRTLAFHRDFRRYSGGPGKVWDYFNHANAHPHWQASVYLTPTSASAENPWLAAPAGISARIQRSWDPSRADAVFLGGMDWDAYPHDDDARPVINLVQGVRHADPSHPLFAFLSRRAIRICVGTPVADAITATARVNGPVRVIEAGLRLPVQPAAAPSRAGIFIGALKQPELGRALAANLRAQGHAVTLADQWVPRERYLAHLATAEIAVLLPVANEGFFLPALEAMALGCATVVPDCVGNRAYLASGTNALVPPMQLEALLQAVAQLDDPGLRARLVQAGIETSARFSLERERAAFHALLDDLNALWRQ